MGWGWGGECSGFPPADRYMVQNGLGRPGRHGEMSEVKYCLELHRRMRELFTKEVYCGTREHRRRLEGWVTGTTAGDSRSDSDLRGGFNLMAVKSRLTRVKAALIEVYDVVASIVIIVVCVILGIFALIFTGFFVGVMLGVALSGFRMVTGL